MVRVHEHDTGVEPGHHNTQMMKGERARAGKIVIRTKWSGGVLCSWFSARVEVSEE